ncbi:MAG: MraY family glycosyltransferase [Candidatus Omnitrophota bacterium]
MSLLCVFLVSAVVSVMLVPQTIRISNRFRIFKPLKDSVKGKPCVGGLGIYFAFLAGVLIALFFGRVDGFKLSGIVAASTLVLALGLIDDINDLRPSLKILGELLGACILIFFGMVTKIAFFPGWLNIVITMAWVLFITNAFNLLDIMDGLMSGLTVIISLTLLVVSVVNKDSFSSIVLVALLAAHLGFLRYNYPPAKVYMGDTGSLFSGFLLAVISINISYAPMERKMALLTPVLAMSLPLYDTLFLIIMRAKKKRPIFKKTKDHFALRLMTMGHSVQKSIWVMYIFSVFLGGLAIITAFSGNLIGAAALAIAVFVFIAMGRKVGMVRVED